MWLAGFIIGTVLGSFVKALAERSLGHESFWKRSYCPKCQHKLAWYDLFPVLSYIFLRGKCRYCQDRIGIEYLVVEVVMGILIGFLFWQSFLNFKFEFSNFYSISNVKFQISNFIFELISKTFFIVILAMLFLTDLKKMIIPDRIILPAIIIAVISLLLVTVYKIIDGILTGGAIALFFLSLIIITRGKGMGGGDVKLGAFIGLMLGFPQALFALGLAFLTGAVLGVGLIISGKKHFGQTIPFGPFLVLGSLIMLFWGQVIVEWYLQLSR